MRVRVPVNPGLVVYRVAGVSSAIRQRLATRDKLS